MDSACLGRTVRRAVLAGLFVAGAAGAAELPPLPPAVDVKQRPKVEMLPPSAKRPAGGFSLADPATAPRREPASNAPSGGINFDPPEPRFESLDLSRRP